MKALIRLIFGNLLTYNSLVEVQAEYILIKTINGPLGQVLVSRLRAEGIDLRLINSNASSIYPLDTFGTRLEVRADQKEEAISMISQIEASSLEPNPEMDFSDADMDDIEFEKEMQAREERIKNSKPPTLIYVLMLIIIVSIFYAVTLMR